MSKTLVVVESPAKAKTIKKYLGSGYEVLASKGHVKDLPKKLGVDVANGFLETYEVIVGKEKVLSELKSAAANADHILLATDPDREGEAIAWHLSEELGVKNPQRVEFHEITKAGVQRGVASPRPLDKQLYDAQRARRVLDRLVGYEVSGLVWKKLAFGLSAGRVQSVALRLIVDREREVEAFVPVEYWNCGASLANTAKQSFFARLTGKNGDKLEVKTGAEALAARAELEKATYSVKKVTRSERRRRAAAPYTTSKLQQDAVSRLGFTAKRTMQVAQGLYEGVDFGKEGGSVGLITYMRTDSTRAAPEAIEAVREHIAAAYGSAYVPPQPNEFKSKKNTQDAHECVRPTSMDLAPDAVKKHLKDEQYKLYKLIFDRFVASQMKDAVYDQTGVDIEAKSGSNLYALRVGGRVLKFAGWLAAVGVSVIVAGEDADKKEGEAPSSDDEDATLPDLKEGERLTLHTPPGVVTEQKFTQPPPRYNEGSLVRELEERGIGRPSTYAEIISKVQARDYVEKLEGRFKPSTLGKFIVDGLVGAALDFIDPAFTSNMEEQLDEVEAGKEERAVLLGRFYKRFRSQLDAASKKAGRWNPEPEPTGEKCAECGEGEMMKRWSKNGWFLGCSNYPKCKTTRDLGKDGDGQGISKTRPAGVDCEKCGKPMIIRGGRYGEFMACTGYPKCKNARPVPLGVACTKCGGDLIEIRSKKKGGKTFYGCSNYANEAIKCDFKLWQKPIMEPCPMCAAKFLVMGGTKAKPTIMCADKTCGYKRVVEAAGESAAQAESGA